MKIETADKIRLSGTVGDARYKIGVVDPYSGRKSVAIGPRHLKAFQSLLSTLDSDQLNEEFAIDENDLARRLPSPDGVALLKQLLRCWAKLRATETEHTWTFANVSFYEKDGRRSMIVRFNDATVELIRNLTGAAPSAGLEHR